MDAAYKVSKHTRGQGDTHILTLRTEEGVYAGYLTLLYKAPERVDLAHKVTVHVV